MNDENPQHEYLILEEIIKEMPDRPEKYSIFPEHSGRLDLVLTSSFFISDQNRLTFGFDKTQLAADSIRIKASINTFEHDHSSLLDEHRKVIEEWRSQRRMPNSNQLPELIRQYLSALDMKRHIDQMNDDQVLYVSITPQFTLCPIGNPMYRIEIHDTGREVIDNIPDNREMIAQYFETQITQINTPTRKKETILQLRRWLDNKKKEDLKRMCRYSRNDLLNFEQKINVLNNSLLFNLSNLQVLGEDIYFNCSIVRCETHVKAYIPHANVNEFLNRIIDLSTRVLNSNSRLNPIRDTQNDFLFILKDDKKQILKHFFENFKDRRFYRSQFTADNFQLIYKEFQALDDGSLSRFYDSNIQKIKQILNEEEGDKKAFSEHCHEIFHSYTTILENHTNAIVLISVCQQMQQELNKPFAYLEFSIHQNPPVTYSCSTIFTSNSSGQ